MKTLKKNNILKQANYFNFRGVKSLIQQSGCLDPIGTKALLVGNRFRAFKVDCDEAYVQRIVDEASQQLQRQNVTQPTISWSKISNQLLVDPKFNIEPVSNYIKFDDIIKFTCENTTLSFWVGAAISLFVCVNNESIIKFLDLRVKEYGVFLSAVLKTTKSVLTTLGKNIGTLTNKFKIYLIKSAIWLIHYCCDEENARKLSLFFASIAAKKQLARYVEGFRNYLSRKA
jgi:hypothetical protein